MYHYYDAKIIYLTFKLMIYIYNKYLMWLKANLVMNSINFS